MGLDVYQAAISRNVDKKVFVNRGNLYRYLWTIYSLKIAIKTDR